MKSAGSDSQQYKAIGQKIRRYREEASLSQAELSRRIGFKSSTAIFDLETGKRRLKVADLISIASALGVGINDLLDVTSAREDVSQNESQWISSQSTFWQPSKSSEQSNYR